jgi:TRAP-type C4-dicarboxylate transport system permease small subunit
MPAPEITGPVFGTLLLAGLIWFGLATVRRRTGKGLVPRSLEPVLALVATAGTFGLGWVMLHRPSNEFYVIVWALVCIGFFVGQMKKRDDGKVRGLLAVIPIAALGGIGVHRVVPEGYSWAKEVAMILLVWTGLIGASMAAHEGRHIEIEFGRKVFPKKWRPAITVAAHLVTFAFCGLIVLLGARYVFGPTGLYKLDGRFPHTGIPDWIVGFAIPWCFGVIGLRTLLVAKRVLGGTADAKGSSLSAVVRGPGEH